VVADHAVARGEADQGVVVPGGGGVDVVVPIEVQWADLAAIGGADALPWALNASLVVSTPLGERTLPLHASGTLPVLARPTVAVEAVRFGANAAGLGLAVDLRLSTTRAASWSVERAELAVTLDGEPLLGGLATTRADDAGVVIGLEVGVSPSVGLASARRLWAGEEVIARFLVQADVRTPLGVLPFEHRVERGLTWAPSP
jgi:hypothetical protein